MSDSSSLKGSCLCQAVNFTVSAASSSVGACHCTFCRKWGGGPLFAIDCGTDVSFDSSENVKVYNSSTWAERGFCAQCGSHLFYRLKENQQYIMPVGLFDETGPLAFDHQVFVDEKPDYYDFSNKTNDLTGAEVFAQYSSEN